MRIIVTAMLAFLVWVGPASARSPDQPDYKKIEKLFSGDQTIVGETIHYPEGSPVNIRSLIVTLKPGETTGWHKHGVPTYGYILSGVLNVDYGEKGKRVYRAGDAFMEAMDWWHNGSNDTGKPARVLVVFMGAKGPPPLSVKARRRRRQNNTTGRDTNAGYETHSDYPPVAARGDGAGRARP